MAESQNMQPQVAFAELAKITLADHTFDAVMVKIAALAKSTVPGAAEVSITLVDRGRPTTVAHTGEMALRLDERQYERGYGPCLDCIEGGEPVVINDLHGEHRWGDWGKAAVELGAASSMSIPVPLQREVSAAINIYSTQPEVFSQEAAELAASFAAYAGVALANMHMYEAQGQLAEQLQTAMQSRAVIEQAKGILMAQRRCTAQEAFDLLVKLSQNSNRKLRDVAHALVHEATKGDR